MEEVKITSVEKVKDPKRVEAGKRLGAMSKQAKEKKAVDKLAQKMSDDEFQTPSIDSVSPLAVVGVIGVVGIAVYYKYFCGTSKASGSKSETKSETVKSEVKPKSEVTPKAEKVNPPKRRELDTLD